MTVKDIVISANDNQKVRIVDNLMKEVLFAGNAENVPGWVTDWEVMYIEAVQSALLLTCEKR